MKHFLLVPLAAAWLVVLASQPVAAQPFVREVSPFPVTDLYGELLIQPFLGGFDTPRPAVGDVTGDGTPDVLVVEQTGSAILLENTGGTGDASFVWRTDRFGGIDVGEWLRLFDGDGDGDLDVLGQFGFTYVRYFRNDGGTYTLAIDTLRDSTGSLIDEVEAQNMPGFGDVTCDGRPDLMAAQLDGTLTVYPALAPQNGMPRFGPPIRQFGGILVQEGLSKNAAPLHGAATVEGGDVEGDGDIDILWGNFFAKAIILLENTTGCPDATFERAEAFFPTDTFTSGGYNMAAWGDLNGDGHGDVLVSTLGGAFTATDRGLNVDILSYFSSSAQGTFTHETSRLGSQLDVGTLSRIAAGDLDGDGDLDLLVSTQTDSTQRRGRLYGWENVGTRSDPRFVPHGLDLPDDARFGLAPTLGDLDSDGDLDLLVGAFDGSVTVLRATGAFTFETFLNVGFRIPRGSNATPALGDLDGDGDLDLLVGENSGSINAYRNDGTPQVPRFTLTTEQLFDPRARPGANVTPALADLDGDGDLDLYVGTQANGFVVFANTGTARTYAFAPYTPFLSDTETSRLPAEASPAFADLDGDGDLDLLSGTKSGGVVFYRNDRIPTAAEAPHHARSSSLRLLGAVPNPSSQQVALRFALTHPERVEVCVFDLLGRERLCTATSFEAGTHDQPLTLTDAPAGVYLYRIRAGAHRVTGRLVRQP